jgi:hypothetical protein
MLLHQKSTLLVNLRHTFELFKDILSLLLSSDHLFALLYFFKFHLVLEKLP